VQIRFENVLYFPATSICFRNHIWYISSTKWNKKLTRTFPKFKILDSHPRPPPVFPRDRCSGIHRMKATIFNYRYQIFFVFNLQLTQSQNFVSHHVHIIIKANNFLYCIVVALFNPSAWGHLNPSSYCDVGRLFYGVFKLWSKWQRKKWRNNF